MSEANVQINQEAFQRRGVEATFDQGAFDQLVGEYAPDTEPPEIVITPHMLWDKGSIIQRLKNLTSGETTLPVGGYSHSEGRITIPASEDEARTNKLLLHETKHFIDDSTGESHESPKIMKRRLIGGLATAATGIAIGLITGNRKVTAASAALAVASPAVAYWRAPHEVAARRFAEEPDVTEKYGKIISYK